MLPIVRLRTCALAVFPAMLAAPAAASAAIPGGGAAFPGAPAVASAKCATGERWRCAAGERLTIRGQELDGVTSVAFMGGRGGRDDRPAPVRRTRANVVRVVVPEGARSGPLRIRTEASVARTSRRVRVVSSRQTTAAPAPERAATSAPRTPGMIFPIRGRHDMGQSETNNFGGGRNHQGQDLFAACGTPLVAITSGVVQQKAYHSAAGHYVVLRTKAGESFAYMHLDAASPLTHGQSVSTGDSVGRVGQTGRATGCHLHFEQWTAPGWYMGGSAIDPLPLLRRLEGEPHAHS